MYETSHQGLTEFDICAAEYSWLISIALRVAHIVMSQIVICSMGILSQASQLFLACSEWKQILLMYVLVFFLVMIIWQQFFLIHQCSCQLPCSFLCASPNAFMFSVTMHLLPYYSHLGSSWGESSSGRITNWLVLKNLTPQVRLGLRGCVRAGGAAEPCSSPSFVLPVLTSAFVSPLDRWLNPAYSVHAARSTNNIPP